MSAMCEKEIRIGILAIQGNFSEHRDHLHRLNRNVKAFLVRTLDDFNAANPHGILLPGGESSTHRVAFRDSAPLFERLKSWACTEKRPIWVKNFKKTSLTKKGTCCGLILLSKKVNDTQESHSLDAIDISTIRNAYGSQSESFSAEVSFPEFPNRKVKGLFIRAPVISNIWGNTKILGTINRKMCEGAYLTENGDHPVALSSENVLVTTFHPEFTPDLTMHHYFIDIVERYMQNFPKPNSRNENARDSKRERG